MVLVLIFKHCNVLDNTCCFMRLLVYNFYFETEYILCCLVWDLELFSLLTGRDIRSKGVEGVSSHICLPVCDT
jgi:hypothetical protein